MGHYCNGGALHTKLACVCFSWSRCARHHCRIKRPNKIDCKACNLVPQKQKALSTFQACRFQDVVYHRKEEGWPTHLDMDIL